MAPDEDHDRDPEQPAEPDEPATDAAAPTPAADEEPNGEGDSDDDAAPDGEPPRHASVPARLPAGFVLPPSTRKAIQDAMRTMATLSAEQLRPALIDFSKFDWSYLEAARKAALALPALDVRVALPKLTIDPALLAVNREVTERLAQLGTDFGKVFAPVLEPWSKSLVEQVQRAMRIDPDLLARIREAAERLMPENVRGLSIKDLLRLVALAAKHRVGVIYALRPELLTHLLDHADDEAEIDAILNDFAEDDLTFVEGVLGQVIEKDPRLAGLAVLLMEAVTALRAGLPAASQALSTNVWDTEISWAAGKGRKAITYAKGLSRTEQEMQDEGLYELFESAVHAPLVAAYVTPNDSEFYSRNGSIHQAQPKQFTKANAVRALTIAVSLVTWHALHGRHD